MPLRPVLLAFLLLCAPLLGCANPVPVVALAGLELTSVAVFGRGVVDMGVSAVSGRDCSLVRLDRGQTYCAPIPQPRVDPYCTRSLGRVDCWADPLLLAGPQPAVGDTPGATAAQERYRLARWPKTVLGD